MILDRMTPDTWTDHRLLVTMMTDVVAIQGVAMMIDTVLPHAMVDMMTGAEITIDEIMTVAMTTAGTKLLRSPRILYSVAICKIAR